MPAPNIKKFDKKVNPFTGEFQLYRNHSEAAVYVNGSDYDVQVEDEVIIYQDITIRLVNLPKQNLAVGHFYKIKKDPTGIGVVRVGVQGGALIDGASTYLMSRPNQSTVFYTDGLQYFVISDYHL